VSAGPGPEDAALIGTEAEVAERIEKLREAGVDEFVGVTFGSSEQRARSRALLLTCK
jgi:5,10-methylenetetrahydromethanopterin reductase